MAVYRILMVGDEAYDRLIADPEDAGLPDVVQACGLYTDFEVHVMWPQDRGFHIIVEGDGSVDTLADLLTNSLSGGDWQRVDRTRIYEAEEPPEGLEAGAQADWVIDTVAPRGANEPKVRRCHLCRRSAVPPHAPKCRAEKRDDGQAIESLQLTPTIGGTGGEAIQAPAAPEWLKVRA